MQSPTPSSPSANQVIEITSVKANATDNGVEVILETPRGEQLQVSNRNQGNSLIADIPNAQLRLPNGDGFTFRSEKPIAGITEITLTNFDANTIRVIVTLMLAESERLLLIRFGGWKTLLLHLWQPKF